MKTATFLAFFAVAAAVFTGFYSLHPSVRDVRLQVLAATVRVRVGAYSGSGLMYHDGVVLTAAHLLQDQNGKDDAPPSLSSEQVLIERPGKEPIPATILGYDFDEDLALLLTHGSSDLQRSFVHWAEPALLDRVYVAGCPLGYDPICMPGEILSLEDELAGKSYHAESAPMTFGTSGGVVFEVIGGRPVFLGVVSRMDHRSQNIQWFVPAARVTAFLARFGGGGPCQ